MQKSAMIDRRAFLKVAGIASGGLFLPKVDIVWPPEVNIFYPVRWFNVFALTIDDGFYPDKVEWYVRILAEKWGVTGLTWFANGYCLRRMINHPLADYMKDLGWEIGYHTMWHPSVEDQLANYDVRRWKQDYDEWRYLAYEAFHGRKDVSYYDNTGVIKNYVRPAGGLCSRPFMEMSRLNNLEVFGWSKDPYVINRGEEIESGDIFLTHFRDSEIPALTDILNRMNNKDGPRPIKLSDLKRLSRIALKSRLSRIKRSKR